MFLFEVKLRSFDMGKQYFFFPIAKLLSPSVHFSILIDKTILHS